MRENVVRNSVAILVTVILVGCVTRSSPPAPPTPPMAGMRPSIVPKPVYKVGNAYQVGGTWYYPKEEPDYDETGIASWYGIDYHGKPTANGEIFDLNRVTAAHPTLPMPINVRVTNLENGRSLVVRVNDRGPYVKGRILDLSEHAADLLGFRNKGIARVRVTFLGRADLYGLGLAPPSQETPPEVAYAVPAVPVSGVKAAALPSVPGAQVAPPSRVETLPKPAEPIVLPSAPQLVADGQVMNVPVPAATDLYVQAGAFMSPVNAATVAARLTSVGARVYQARKDGHPLYRVRIGPFQAVPEADAALARVQALGHIDVQIVVEAAKS